MLRYVLSRLAAVVPLLFVISILTFALVHIVPGSVAETMLGTGASPEAVAELEHQMGLDRPFLRQYGDWLGDALRGDLGTSTRTAQPVGTQLADRLPATLSLAVGALVAGALIGLALGVVASLRAGGIVDRLVTITTSVALAVPAFWVGILLSVIVGVRWGWLPAGGFRGLTANPWEWMRRLILPWIALSLGATAVIARQMRSSMVAVLRSDHLRAAVGLGLPRGAVVRRHVLKNAITPVISVIGFQFVVILGTSFVIEQAFNVPGIGSMTVQAIFDRDIPLVQGAILVTSVLVLAVNLLADVAFAWANPKIRR